LYASPAAKLQNGKLSQAEYDFIHSDVDEQEAEKADVAQAKVSWFKLLTFRQTWAFVIGKFLTDPIWWFFLFWLPSFLDGENARKVKEFMAAFPTDPNTLKVNEYLAANSGYTGSLASIPGVDFPGVISWQIAVAVIYCISTVGSISGGWLPKQLINGGMDANKARKTAMFIIALFPLTVLLASRLGAINTWYAVLTIAIACAAHQAWSCNIFVTVSDMFPKKVIASVTGIGGMAGSVGGILIAYAAGLLLQHFRNLEKTEVGYGILFVVCGSAYIIAWVLMHLLVPKFKKIVL
jgi:ACS family hexuronate transporter-like MFS transporter